MIASEIAVVRREIIVVYRGILQFDRPNLSNLKKRATELQMCEGEETEFKICP